MASVPPTSVPNCVEINRSLLMEHFPLGGRGRHLAQTTLKNAASTYIMILHSDMYSWFVSSSNQSVTRPPFRKGQRSRFSLITMLKTQESAMQDKTLWNKTLRLETLNTRYTESSSPDAVNDNNGNLSSVSSKLGGPLVSERQIGDHFFSRPLLISRSRSAKPGHQGDGSIGGTWDPLRLLDRSFHGSFSLIAKAGKQPNPRHPLPEEL